MSFGFSAGDFLAGMRLLQGLHERFRDAPAHFTAIKGEVESFQRVYIELCTTVPQEKLSEHQKQRVNETLKALENTLKTLEKALIKYHELGAPADSKEKVQAKAKRAWKRLTFEPGDIELLRHQLNSHVHSLNTIIGTVNNAAIASQGEMSAKILAVASNVESLQLSEAEIQEKEKILTCFSSTDYRLRQEDAQDRREDDTGTWLLESPEFQEWLGRKGRRTMFCPGIPGAGKTILASVVIEHLLDAFGHDPQYAIVFIYLDHTQREEQRITSLLLNIIKQLVQRKTSIPESARALYAAYQKKLSWPSVDNLKMTLGAILDGYSTIFIVLDALDEHNHRPHLQNLLDTIFEMQEQRSVSLFATSREIPSIEANFKDAAKCITLDIRAQSADIIKYLRGNIHLLPFCVTSRPDLVGEVIQHISSAVDGIFLLARLHLESLQGARSVRAIRTTLNSLPQGSNAYDSAYDMAMERINAQVQSSRDLALQVLTWIAYAERRLNVYELRHALSVEPDMTDFDPDNLPEIEDMLSVCAGLVSVARGTELVGLVHYTTQEYLNRNMVRFVANPHAGISSACITYLSFKSFSDMFKSGSRRSDMISRLPLLPYAARFWAKHAGNSCAGVVEGSIDLLENETVISAISKVTHYEDDTYLRGLNGLHITARSGYLAATNELIKRGSSVNSTTYNGVTPIHWAAKFGNSEMAQFLLTKGADINYRNDQGRTPVSLAAAKGHEQVVKMLLENKADIHIRCNEGLSPLAYASAGESYSIVQLLLDHGADVNMLNNARRGPIFHAVSKGNREIISTLINGGANIYVRSVWGDTPLHKAIKSTDRELFRLLWGEYTTNQDKSISMSDISNDLLCDAILAGNEELVSMLLDSGADPNGCGLRGMIPLCAAAGPMKTSLGTASGWSYRPPEPEEEERRQRIVRRLLESGAQVDNSALHEAASNWGMHSVIDLLVAWKADVNFRDAKGRTPLHGVNEESVMDSLLGHGADINAQDDQGATLLSKAVCVNEDLVQPLLERGARTDLADDQGCTPLSYAATFRDEKVLRVLLDHDREVDKADINGRTPLSYLVHGSHEERRFTWFSWKERPPAGERLIRMFLEKGASPGCQASDGRAPVTYAVKTGNMAAMQLFIDKGVPLDLVDSNDRTLLSHTAEQGHLDMACLLLNHGAGTNLPDRDNRTPLSYAAGAGSVLLIERLLREGSDVDSVDTTGRSPLSYAIEYGHEDIVDLLEERGAEILRTDKSNRCSVSYAAGSQNEALLRRMLDLGISADRADIDGRTPLSYAAEGQHSPCIELLLGRGARVDIADKTGRTPLSYGIWDREREHLGAPFTEEICCSKLLLEHGADPNSRDVGGRTPLSYAAEVGEVPWARLLLSYGADPSIPDVNGHLPLIYAMNRTYADQGTAMLDLILQYTQPEQITDDVLKVTARCANNRKQVQKVIDKTGRPVDISTLRGERSG